MAAAENVTGVWDGVEVQCTGTKVDAQYHSFYWQALYTMAVPKEKADAVAAAAVPGGTGDIYAGLNPEEKSVLDEFISAGYPLPVIGNHFKSLTPLVDPIACAYSIRPTKTISGPSPAMRAPIRRTT